MGRSEARWFHCSLHSSNRQDLKSCIMVVKFYLIASFVAALVLCATAELPSEGSDVAKVEDLRLKREAMPEPKKKEARKGNNGNGKKHNNGKTGNRRQNVKKSTERKKNTNKSNKKSKKGKKEKKNGLRKQKNSRK